MKLVGMLDSPYVRRVAISLELYGVDFVHEPLSVFSTYNAFARINPVVKAPTLVLDDGTVLMDSSLILDYLETLAPADRKLLPQPPAARAKDLQLLGLALAACEKSVQIVYEHNLRRPRSSMRRGSTAQRAIAGRVYAAGQTPEPGRQRSADPGLADGSGRLVLQPVHRGLGGQGGCVPHVQRHAERLEQHPAFKRYPIE